MRKLLLVVSLISILALSGCSVFSGSSTAKSHAKILRQTELAGKWQMYQVEVTLASGTEMPIIIQLADGNKADGYFYVEKGDSSIAFQISGISQIYQSDFKSIPSGQPASDRFSFTAAQAQGLSYEMTLRNTADSSKKTTSTVFFELIYPGDSSVFTPLEDN